MLPSTQPLFWRDEALSFVELRQVLDGRDVSYAPHSHEEWSIGAILDGQSEFLCADRIHSVEFGTLVMMDPDVVHACNPSQDSPWAYYMMHVNKDWLASLLFDEGIRGISSWKNSQCDILNDDTLFNGFVVLCESLMSAKVTASEKERLLKKYLLRLFAQINEKESSFHHLPPESKLYKVADYLSQNCFDETPVDTVSRQFGFSTGYFMRAFKRHFNMTPHAYRLNRRIQLGQQALKKGESIADIAHGGGFSDQAHFQRVFKKRVAATPDQYRRSVQKT